MNSGEPFRDIPWRSIGYKGLCRTLAQESEIMLKFDKSSEVFNTIAQDSGLEVRNNNTLEWLLSYEEHA